jgi:glyoxylase-like metal-dependent hydrolase (beta-lactamase superfamily II)
MRERMKPLMVTDSIYLVGDSNLTDPKDCSVYIIDLGELIMIDSGAGTSVPAIAENIGKLGLDPARISTIILTHCHIDHVGGAAEFQRRYGARIVMHYLDAPPVEQGDGRKTGAAWYGLDLAPLPIDLKLMRDEERLVYGGQEIICLHTPGHSPGSISLYIDHGGQRILFGQDIHGPFLPEFGANMADWRRSMEKLLALRADILCEGHFGVFHPAGKVTEYIERYLEEYGE